jgi:hypothetical protein
VEPRRPLGPEDRGTELVTQQNSEYRISSSTPAKPRDRVTAGNGMTHPEVGTVIMVGLSRSGIVESFLLVNLHIVPCLGPTGLLVWPSEHHVTRATKFSARTRHGEPLQVEDLPTQGHEMRNVLIVPPSPNFNNLASIYGVRTPVYLA